MDFAKKQIVFLIYTHCCIFKKQMHICVFGVHFLIRFDDIVTLICQLRYHICLLTTICFGGKFVKSNWCRGI